MTNDSFFETVDEKHISDWDVRSSMAVNGKLLSIEEREELWAYGWEQLPKERAAATVLLFNDRQASLDSLHQFLHGPRKAPVKDKIKCIVAKEIRCDAVLIKKTLVDCKEATSLILEKNEIRAEGLEQLVGALQGRTAIEVLSLKRNLIGDKGATVLGTMMTNWKCRKLHTLCLSFCNISGLGIEGLCKGLSRMPTVLSLTSLDLSANFCKADGCKILAPFIMDHRKLQYLNLGSNCIEDEGVKALLEAVGNSDVLQTLNLEGNHITNTGVRFVCDALKKNCALNDIGLQCNEIDHSGAMYLSQAIRNNTVLTKLNVSHNSMGDTGAEHMAGLIRSSTTLIELQLVNNSIGDKGGKFIQLAYEKNTRLTLLDLDMNKMQDAQHQGLANAMRIRGNIGILRVGCHAYGNLRPDNKLLEMVKAQIELEEAEKENASKPQTPNTPLNVKPGTPRKAGLDTGSVILIVKVKEEVPKPTGPLGVLFKKWSGAGEGQKNSKLAKSVDFKEFLEMLKALKLMPGKIGRHKAQEIFRQANRRGDDPTPDGDTSEMDWDEFEFAFKKICEFCKVDAETLVKDSAGVEADTKNSPRKKNPPLKGAEKNAAKAAELAPDASLNDIFMKFAAGDGQSKKRAASMDGKEFIALIEFLKLMPSKINKTQVMDLFSKGKAKSGGDKSEMDWDGFEFAMKKVADMVGISYGLLHTHHQSAEKSQSKPGPGVSLKQVSSKISTALKLTGRKAPAPQTSAAKHPSPKTSPRNPSLKQASIKVSNALKATGAKKDPT